MSPRSVVIHGLLFGAFSGACALSCGSDDAKTAVRGQQGGEAGADLGAGGELRGGATSGSGGVTAAGEGGFTPAGDGGVTTAGGGSATSAGEGGVATAGEGGASPGGAAGGGGGARSLPFRLFNTGVDDDGAVLEGGAVDPHYTLIESADATFKGPDAVVPTQIAGGYWLAPSEASNWIAPSPNQSYPTPPDPCNATGTYVYRTSFDLTGYDPQTLTITGAWGADNSGADIRLNGTGLGKPAGGYNPLTAFTIEGGFLPGINTLDFVVTDIGCPNGLRVELSASDVQPLPEP